MEMVLIKLDEYKRLVKSDTELKQLESIGVDNWSGYGEYNSITGGDQLQEIEDAQKECEKFIFYMSYGSEIIKDQGNIRGDIVMDTPYCIGCHTYHYGKCNPLGETCTVSDTGGETI